MSWIRQHHVSPQRPIGCFRRRWKSRRGQSVCFFFSFSGPLSSCFQSKSCKTVPESRSMLTHFWSTANQWNSTNSNVICFLSLLLHLLLLLLLDGPLLPSITPLLLSALRHLHLLQFPAGKTKLAPYLKMASALKKHFEVTR